TSNHSHGSTYTIQADMKQAYYTMVVPNNDTCSISSYSGIVSVNNFTDVNGRKYSAIVTTYDANITIVFKTICGHYYNNNSVNTSTVKSYLSCYIGTVLDGKFSSAGPMEKFENTTNIYKTVTFVCTKNTMTKNYTSGAVSGMSIYESSIDLYRHKLSTPRDVDNNTYSSIDSYVKYNGTGYSTLYMNNDCDVKEVTLAVTENDIPDGYRFYYWEYSYDNVTFERFSQDETDASYKNNYVVSIENTPKYYRAVIKKREINGLVQMSVDGISKSADDYTRLPVDYGHILWKNVTRNDPSYTNFLSTMSIDPMPECTDTYSLDFSYYNDDSRYYAYYLIEFKDSTTNSIDGYHTENTTLLATDSKYSSDAVSITIPKDAYGITITVQYMQITWDMMGSYNLGKITTGSGTAASPYIITNPYQFGRYIYNVNNSINYYYTYYMIAASGQLDFSAFFMSDCTAYNNYTHLYAEEPVKLTGIDVLEYYAMGYINYPLFGYNISGSIKNIILYEPQFTFRSLGGYAYSVEQGYASNYYSNCAIFGYSLSSSTVSNCGIYQEDNAVTLNLTTLPYASKYSTCNFMFSGMFVEMTNSKFFSNYAVMHYELNAPGQMSTNATFTGLMGDSKADTQKYHDCYSNMHVDVVGMESSKFAVNVNVLMYGRTNGALIDNMYFGFLKFNATTSDSTGYNGALKIYGFETNNGTLQDFYYNATVADNCNVTVPYKAFSATIQTMATGISSLTQQQMEDRSSFAGFVFGTYWAFEEPTSKGEWTDTYMQPNYKMPILTTDNLERYTAYVEIYLDESTQASVIGTDNDETISFKGWTVDAFYEVVFDYAIEVNISKIVKNTAYLDK
ncbi:MAG: hypothetical protein IJW28_01855, partial [Clostridia bacterium]|nr:hypothetical protein [Clostridia bacterium]